MTTVAGMSPEKQALLVKFGREVIQRRDVLRFSLRDLHFYSGIDPNHLEQIEQGEVEVGIFNALQIALSLNADLTELLGVKQYVVMIRGIDLASDHPAGQMPEGTLRRRFRANLRRLRITLRISQDLLAEHSGVDRAFISLLERDLRQATVTTVERIANGLKVHPCVLLCESPIDPTKSPDPMAALRRVKRRGLPGDRQS